MKKMDEITDDFPSEGELVMCTVKKVFNQGANVIIDGYNKEGLLHVTEISLRWVKNIRDYVKEDQKVILKVINVNKERGHIDLSLRRVTESERKLKIMDIKKKQREKKFIEFLSKELNIEIEELYKKLKPLSDNYGSIYAGMEEIAKNKNIPKNLDIDLEKKTEKKLIKLINENIKPRTVKISGFLTLKSYDGNGVEIIKKILKKTIIPDKTNVTYTAAGRYKIDAFSDNYKSAEKILKDVVESTSSYAKENKCEFEFSRDNKKAAVRNQ